jgi:hypothetical protein
MWDFNLILSTSSRKYNKLLKVRLVLLKKPDVASGLPLW